VPIASFDLGDALLSLLVVFFMVIYFLIMFQIIVDVFRRDDSGVKKALWLIALLVIPLVTMLAYMITNGDGMARRQQQQVVQAQQEMDGYIRTVAGGATGEIAKAKELLDSGAITQEEYDALKAKALSA
jgi:ABC-type multidrug transport system fused ATPase/permease subunit